AVRGRSEAASTAVLKPHVITGREDPAAAVQPLHHPNLQTADTGVATLQSSVPRHGTETILVPGVSDAPVAADVSGSDPALDGDGLAAALPAEGQGGPPASQPEPGAMRNLTAPPNVNEISAYTAARSVDAVRAPNSSDDPNALATSPAIPAHGVASPVPS